MDWFKCCYHCQKPERGIGCHSRCLDYKKATIKKNLESRWLRKKRNEEEAMFSPGVQKYVESRKKKKRS